MYYNNLPHASVPGCVDIAQVRDPDTGTIWHPKTMNYNDLTSLEGIKRLHVDEVLKKGMLNPFLLVGLAC